MEYMYFNRNIIDNIIMKIAVVHRNLEKINISILVDIRIIIVMKVELFLVS